VTFIRFIRFTRFTHFPLLVVATYCKLSTRDPKSRTKCDVPEGTINKTG
jgi:hypothetical protein